MGSQATHSERANAGYRVTDSPAAEKLILENPENGLFHMENGSEARSPDFSGLRMRDGKTLIQSHRNTNPMHENTF